jgi:hypothetical protein
VQIQAAATDQPSPAARYERIQEEVMQDDGLAARAVFRMLGVAIALLFVSLQPGHPVVLASTQPMPRSLSDSAVQGCEDVLATPGTRWDGLKMEPMTWAGVRFALESIAGSLVVVCVASGPQHLLPATNRIGCLLVGEQLATVDGKLACGAYQSVSRVGEAEVHWQSQVSAAVSSVQVLHWNGEEFEAGESFLQCWDGTRTDEQLDCPVPQ